MARSLGPRGIHVAYVVIDAVIDVPWTRERFAGKPDDFFAKPEDLRVAAPRRRGAGTRWPRERAERNALGSYWGRRSSSAACAQVASGRPTLAHSSAASHTSSSFVGERPGA